MRLGRAFDPNFLAKRQASLQSYLESLLQVPGVLDDRSLQHFLDLEKRVDWNGELAGGAGSNGRPSGSFPGKSVLLNENDRLNAIVENAGLAFIDISEVPEPLDAEQAVQRKNEIVSASQSLLSDQKIAEHFAATMTVLELPQPPSAARLAHEELIARLENAHEDGATYEQDQELLAAALERAEAALRLEIAPPSSNLLVVMELSLTPAASAAATTSRGSLSGPLDDGDNGLSSSFH
ncbi:hypothetical protein PybrP1_001857 [[Pythium] brassicae (nom. inval.)]|nr:hypothetical protein PybrP1_001857 [[Pythium] brassicae (nom. inval.)]